MHFYSLKSGSLTVLTPLLAVVFSQEHKFLTFLCQLGQGMVAIPPSEGAHVESYQPTRKPGCRTQSISGRDWRNSSVSSGTHLHLEGTENEQIICNVHKSHVFYRLTLVSKPVNKRLVYCCSSCWDKKHIYYLIWESFPRCCLQTPPKQSDTDP